MKKLIILAAALSTAIWAQTNVNGSRTYFGTQDFGPDTATRFTTGNGAPSSLNCNSALSITSSTNASPIVITHNSHGYTNGQVLTIYGHAVNTAANGTWVVGGATTNTYQLCGYWDGTTCQNPSTGNGVGSATGFSSLHVGRVYFRNDAAAGTNIYGCADPSVSGTPSWSVLTPGANTKYRTCVIDNDTQSSNALTAPQFSGHCIIPAAATIVEVDVMGGTQTLSSTATAPTLTGTSSIQVGKLSPNGGASNASLLSAALPTASGKACALTTTSGTCLDGLTSSSTVSISTTALAAGDILSVTGATADSAQTWYTVTVIYTIN